MNFFIDFEATQFSNHIISVGCISEKGVPFYIGIDPTADSLHVGHFVSLMVASYMQKAGHKPIILMGGGIVFSQLLEWVKEQSENEKPHFYCYGTSDKHFVKTNFDESETFTASQMLSYLYTDMEDYSDIVKAHFGLNQNISLLKVYNYCSKEDKTQSHNALEDATMLLEVYQYINSHENEFEVFPEYKEIIGKKKLTNQISEITEGKKYIVHRMNSRKVLQTYNSFDEAVEWAYNQIPEGEERNKTNIKTIARNIKKASNGYDEKKKYMNYRWKIIRKG